MTMRFHELSLLGCHYYKAWLITPTRMGMRIVIANLRSACACLNLTDGHGWRWSHLVKSFSTSFFQRGNIAICIKVLAYGVSARCP